MDPAPPPVSPHSVEGDTGGDELPNPWAEAKAKAPPPPAPSGTRSSTTVPSHVVPIMPGRTDLHAASTPIMTSSTLRDHPPSRAPPTIDEHGGAGPGTMDPIDERHAAGPNAGPNQPPASRLAPPARTSRSREFMGGGLHYGDPIPVDDRGIPVEWSWPLRVPERVRGQWPWTHLGEMDFMVPRHSGWMWLYHITYNDRGPPRPLTIHCLWFHNDRRRWFRYNWQVDPTGWDDRQYDLP